MQEGRRTRDRISYAQACPLRPTRRFIILSLQHLFHIVCAVVENGFINIGNDGFRLTAVVIDGQVDPQLSEIEGLEAKCFILGCLLLEKRGE